MRIPTPARPAAAFAAAVGIAALVAGCGGPGSPSAVRDSESAAGGPSASAGTSGPAGGADTGFTVVATGDILIHPPLMEQAQADSGGEGYDFDPLLAGIEPVISAADLAICHLEMPLAAPDGPFFGYPSFSAPPQVATTIADTGYDTCSTASNHSLDQGADGVRRTLDALDAVGVRHTGSARSAEEATSPDLLDVAGVKVAQLSYSYGFNGIPVPAETPWIVNRIDPERILADARAARDAGAEVVIVSLHWGEEYRHEPTEEQESVADTLLADPAIDLIVGHHAHVTQPIARVDGKWVAYGLGNLVARHEDPIPETREGMIARFHFQRGHDGHWAVDRAEYLPTYVDLGPPIRLVDVSSVASDSDLPAARRDEYGRAAADVDQVATSLAGDALTRGTGP